MAQSTNLKTQKGDPAPLGISKKREGVNFALFSQHATGVQLCLFTPGSPEPFAEINLEPDQNKTEHIWHILVKNLPERMEYGYRIDGPHQPEKGLLYDRTKILSDPYAIELANSHHWGEGYDSEHAATPRARIILDTSFDWGGITSPNIPKEDLVIYEMHVRGFSVDSSSKAKHPGTFLGVIEKIPHLKELGINAVELLPVYEFNECENPRKDPVSQKRLWNYWGYSTVDFFAPMNRYATDSEWRSTIDEFKKMVKELHKNKIEVILDVVYNHSAEGNEKGPYFSFRGIDNPNYYILTPDGHYQNYTGCGNTINCNNLPVRHFILDSLRYWVTEMHVDGFRFDLASILTRDPTGKPLEKPPIIAAMNSDPVLSKVKLIAEPWDAAGLYHVGSFPGEGEWAEWNGVYRDVVRRFIKGTDGQAGPFATALCGSQNLYGHDRKPYHSINFIVCHDGFTLHDLVSYNGKHNEVNGENNADGINENDSWNCGAEGKTNDRHILQLRERQMRNFMVALMVSLGTPMVLMGDEYGQTKNGNNNGWAQDSELNWFLWNELKNATGFFNFYKALIHFRLRHPLFRRKDFLSNDDIEWHGHEPLKADWNSRFVAYTLKDRAHSNHYYIAFNAHWEYAHLTLPHPPSLKKWYRVIDTALPYPDNFVDPPYHQHPLTHTYDVHPYSALVFQAH